MMVIRGLCVVVMLVGSMLIAGCREQEQPTVVVPVYSPPAPVPPVLIESLEKLTLGAKVGQVTELYEQKGWPVAVKLLRIDGCSVNDQVTFISYEQAELLRDGLAKDPSPKNTMDAFTKGIKGRIATMNANTNMLYVMYEPLNAGGPPPAPRDLAIIGPWPWR